MTDANNCTASSTITINENPAIIVESAVFTEPTCWGDNNGTISVSAFGGVGSLTYTLNGLGGSSTGNYTGLTAGGYQVRITDALGCFKDTNIVLTQPDPVNLSSIVISPMNCKDVSDGRIMATGSGGRGGYTYYLRPGLQINQVGDFRDLHTGSYTLTVRDSSGCKRDTVLLVGFPETPLDITITKQDLQCFGKGNEAWAQANVVGGQAPFTFLWNTNPPQVAERAENLTYGYYKVEVLDANGCLVKDSIYIEPGPCCEEIFIPNAFSPNGDGNNDVFRVTTATGIELIQFDVFNRWGQRVWGTTDFRAGWDGTFKGEQQDMYTFYYILRYKCLVDGQNYVKKGDIILMR